MNGPATIPGRRKLLLLAALLPALLPVLLPAVAAAKEAAGETYVKLPSIVLEYWDADGIFHAVNMELTAVFPFQTRVDKKVADKISQALTAMTWEDLAQGNPAATIKAVALDVLRKEPGAEGVIEVLVIKLLMR